MRATAPWVKARPFRLTNVLRQHLKAREGRQEGLAAKLAFHVKSATTESVREILVTNISRDAKLHADEAPHPLIGKAHERHEQFMRLIEQRNRARERYGDTDSRKLLALEAIADGITRLTAEIRALRLQDR